MLRWYAVGARWMCCWKAVPCRYALCAVCSSVRSGKWKTSTGNQPVAGQTGCRRARGSHASAGSRDAPVDRLPDRLVEGGGVVDRRVLATGARSSARRRAPVVRARHEERQNAWTIPYASGTAASTSFSDPPRGHQNSSASVLITQSAPYSVAARRAMRVTHSPWRSPRPARGSGGRCPSRAYDSRISVVPSWELLSVAITKSTPAFR